MKKRASHVLNEGDCHVGLTEASGGTSGPSLTDDGLDLRFSEIHDDTGA